MVGNYKSGVNVEKPVRVTLDEQPAIDTGGVRRQVFSDVFALFATNKQFRLFEGQPCSVRPVHSADVRSSGMLKVLGTMIAHSVAMDGVGFPYLSPLSYWYITAGETEALQHMGPSEGNCESRNAGTRNGTRNGGKMQSAPEIRCKVRRK